MSERLNVKDLITVGIFAVILIVLIFAFGMLGYIPILMLALPIIAALICGIPYMLFLTRVSKFGMVTLLGLILGIVMFLSGHTWVPILVFTLFAFIADCILKMGNYSSIKNFDRNEKNIKYIDCNGSHSVIVGSCFCRQRRP